MSREIFGPQKFKVEEKMIEKIAGKEERGKEAKKAPLKTGEVKLSAEERRELREKMDRETAKFLRPVFGEEHAPESEAMEKKIGAEKLLGLREKDRYCTKRRKGHRSEQGDAMFKFYKGGKKPPKHRKISEVRGL